MIGKVFFIENNICSRYIDLQIIPRCDGDPRKREISVTTLKFDLHYQWHTIGIDPSIIALANL